MMSQQNFIIITSIFAPTEAVKAFAEQSGWQVVVVGDKKTPADWDHDGVTFLSAETQEALNYSLVETLPWNHYGRKMLGYLHAIEQGAQVIYDTDDDNIPHPQWEGPRFDNEHVVASSDNGYLNIYDHFTPQTIWPRGFPHRRLLDKPAVTRESKPVKVGVWQYLADEDPDVDAVYRLTRGDQVTFEQNHPLVLEEGTVCPYNSQNTFYRRELFPLLYLPAYVSFRFTDILRGLVAQPVMWSQGYRLGFGGATVLQKRNEHDYHKDFVSEVPVYLHGEQASEIAAETAGPDRNTSDNMRAVYEALHHAEIVPEQELILLEAWLSDLRKLGLNG